VVSRLLAVLAGGALIGLLTSGPVHAAGPADVNVRIEGAATTLVPRTAVRTDAAPINKDGQAGHTCSGTGAAGALEKATGGDWSGPWFDGLGYSVQTIKGESHIFPAPEYYAVWINNRATTEGICGTTTELQQGDDVLFFVDRCISDPVTFLCTNAPVLPLGLIAPRAVNPGAPFGISVVEYAADGTPTPVGGAEITGGDAAVATDAAGHATVTVSQTGAFSLRATKANRAPSASEPVCATSGGDGICGSPDRIAPTAAIMGIAEGQRSSRASAPRRITAKISPDVSGLAVVKLRLTRRVGPRCEYYSGRSERFRRIPCGVNRAPWFAVGDREQVDYLLPQRLGRGRYLLDVNAVDKAGNRDDGRRRGANRVVFHVR
jgi:hypothetical protein